MSAVAESPRTDSRIAYPQGRPAGVELFEHVPGELGAPVVGHTLEFLKDARALIDRMSREYGPNFKLRMFGYPVLLVGEPEAVKTVFMDRERNFSSKLGWDHSIGELFSRGLMLRDFDEHRLHRRIMQAAFRADALHHYVDMMNPSIARGIEPWRQESDFRFYPAIKQLTLDIAAEVFVGIPLGGEADRINKAFVDSVQASIALVKKEVPGLSYRRGMNGRRLLERFFTEHIPEKRAGDGRDMFSEFCRATTEDGESFSDRDIVDHMIFLLMAAHDTTTSSLTTLMYHLAASPEWQERLREEAGALGKSAMEYGDKDGLKQTDWAFKEALRLHPPVPFIGRRALRACEVGGVELPENSAITVSSLITHYLEDVWTEPTRFDPERFSPERAEDRRHSHGWYPFGGGAHTCLGMHFAYLQVRAFLVQFLQKYRVSLEPRAKIDITPIPIPKPRNGLPLRLEPLA